jgi:hypothetical protein
MSSSALLNRAALLGAACIALSALAAPAQAGRNPADNVPRMKLMCKVVEGKDGRSEAEVTSQDPKGDAGKEIVVTTEPKGKEVKHSLKRGDLASLRGEKTVKVPLPPKMKFQNCFADFKA